MKVDILSKLPDREALLAKLPDKEVILAKLPDKQVILAKLPDKEALIAKLPDREAIVRIPGEIRARIPSREDIDPRAVKEGAKDIWCRHKGKIIAGAAGLTLLLTLRHIRKSSPKKMVKNVYKRHGKKLVRAGELFNDLYVENAYSAYVNGDGEVNIDIVGCPGEAECSTEYSNDKALKKTRKALKKSRKKFLKRTKKALRPTVLDRIGAYYDDNGDAIVYMPVTAKKSGKNSYMIYYLVYVQPECEKSFMDEFPVIFKQLDDGWYICGKEYLKG